MKEKRRGAMGKNRKVGKKRRKGKEKKGRRRGNMR